MTWAAVGGAAVGVVGNYLVNRNTGGGGGGGGGGGYVPAGIGAADVGWQQAFGQQQALTGQGATAAAPLYQQTLQQQQALNYAPLAQAGQQAGQQYDWLSNLAGQQAGAYGQQAGLAGAQQRALYGAAGQVAQTAFDPQQALYSRTQQQLADQVRAGQAARGLGVSPVGGAEENQAMSNFNIDWQNQQLARQAQGLQAMGYGSMAGAQQGQLTGANLAAQMQSAGQVPGFTMQGATTPLQTQQYIAGQPAAVGQQYAQGMAGLSGLYGNVGAAAIPYMNQGIGASQVQSQFQTGQNAAEANLLTQLGQAGWKSYNTPGSWMNTTFGGPNTGIGQGYGSGMSPDTMALAGM